MGSVGEIGDEWIVEPVPVLVPTDEPDTVATPQPVGAGETGA